MNRMIQAFLLLFFSYSLQVYAAEENKIQIFLKQNKWLSGDGKVIANLVGPTEVKNTTYVPLRTLVNALGIQLDYDAENQRYVLQEANQKIYYYPEKGTLSRNKVSIKLDGKSFEKQNTMMVPLFSFLKALQFPYTSQKDRILVDTQPKPQAKFKILPKEDIHAQQTEVTYQVEATHPRGLKIVEQYWQGKETIYNEAGTYKVSLRVKDEKGIWSDYATQQIIVKPPNQAPVSHFETSKDVYKMGEMIEYKDLSTDDEDRIVERQWDNKSPAFFKPGVYRVNLHVKDAHGLTHDYEKTITITEEVLYTKKEFDQLFTPIGEKYESEESTLSYQQIRSTSQDNPVTLIRSNSPETIFDEGLLYKSKGSNKIRILVHHKNALDKNLKIYMLVTNPNDIKATLSEEHIGMGGPGIYEQVTGKVSTSKFLEATQKSSLNRVTVLKPKETKVVMPEMSARSLRPKEVISVLADLYADQSLEFKFIAIDEKLDPLTSLPELKPSTPDTHTRGTYLNADRTLEISEPIGTVASRLPLADRINDAYTYGTDQLIGEENVNMGNYGVLYTLNLNRVAPRTLIGFNPRGGPYFGTVLVNGKSVDLSEEGLVNAGREVGALHRTSNHEEKIEIQFTPAPASFLPVSLLLIPLPELKNG